MSKSWIEQKVKEAGYKLTLQREKIFAFVEQYDGIFCAAQILKAVPKMDKVSIYRTLELLAELDIIHGAAQLEGQQYYEVHQEGAHHHHIVCTKCLASDCVSCDMPTKKISGFSHVHHSLTMTGLCTSCTI